MDNSCGRPQELFSDVTKIFNDDSLSTIGARAHVNTLASVCLQSSLWVLPFDDRCCMVLIIYGLDCSESILIKWVLEAGMTVHCCYCKLPRIP